MLAEGAISQVARPAYFSDALVGRSGAGAKWPSPHPGREKLFSIAKPSLEYNHLAFLAGCVVDADAWMK